MRPQNPPPPGAINAAIQLYNPGAAADMRLYAAGDQAFAAAFPLLTLYYVVDGAGLPGHNHTMAWDGTSGFDLTRDFNELLDARAVILATASDALKYAKAFAQTVNAELQLIRQVVSASDSTALGRTIQDPAATLQIDGWQVTLSTWAAENGVLASWTIRFTANRVSHAEWRIDGEGLGAAGLRLEGTSFQVGTTLTNTYGPSGHTIAAAQETPGGPVPARLPQEVEALAWTEIPDTRETNFDGSTWVVYYPSDQFPDVPLSVVQAGKAYAKGGKHAYDAQVLRNARDSGLPCSASHPSVNPNTDNWGFESGDSDCTLEIFVTDSQSLGCQACAERTAEVKLHIFPLLKEFLIAKGYYTHPVNHDIYGLGRVVVGHEHFHSLQNALACIPASAHCSGLARAEVPPFIKEGIARFSETILNPFESDDASSLWYGTAGAPQNNSDGVNYLQLHPDQAMCSFLFEPPQPAGPPDAGADIYVSHAYDYGLYWGYLYSKNGKWDTLRDIMSRIAAKYTLPQTIKPEDCDAEIARAINDSLASLLPTTPHEHASHAEVLAGLGIQMHAKDFKWAAPGDTDRQWGTYLLDVKHEPHTYGPTPQPHMVGAWALQIVPLPLPDQQSYTITYAPGEVGDGASWRVRVVTKRAGTYPDDLIIELQPGQSVTFNADPANEAALVEAVRQSPSLGTYALTLNPGVPPAL